MASPMIIDNSKHVSAEDVTSLLISKGYSVRQKDQISSEMTLVCENGELVCDIDIDEQVIFICSSRFLHKWFVIKPSDFNKIYDYIVGLSELIATHFHLEIL